jgi:hypothetical protein
MGPALTVSEFRAKVWLTLALWGSSFTIFTLLNLLDHEDRFAAAAGVRAVVTLFGMLLCFGLHALLQRLAHKPFRRRAITLAVMAPIAAETYAWFNFFAFAYFNGTSMSMVIADWRAAIENLVFWTWGFMAWTGLYLAIEYSFHAREEERRSAELRNLAHHAKLQALSNQISPHFLFNSLNSISSLILDGRSQDAEKMLTDLSGFLRSTLAIDPLVDVPLSQEFELHCRYLTIEQLRYPDLDIMIMLPEALRSAMVPALILQPLVENAIKHGVAKSSPPTQVRMMAEQSGDSLTLTITDTGRHVAEQQPQQSGGIGLTNVRERLVERFGTGQHLAVNPKDDSFEVILVMPLVFMT